MSDITKCSNGECPLRYECWRFLAPANPCWQSYDSYEYDDVVGELKCDSFIVRR